MVERQIDFTFSRMAKIISSRNDLLALVGKQRISVLKNSIIQKDEQLHTKLIMDFDVCEVGLVGVSQ